MDKIYFFFNKNVYNSTEFKAVVELMIIMITEWKIGYKTNLTILIV